MDKDALDLENKRYTFVDAIRFWSMFAIVFEHCVLFLLPAEYARSTFSLVAILAQVCKFGTIDFFLISGFLVGKAIKSDKLNYFMRRFGNIGIPWLIWSSIYVTITTLWLLFIKHQQVNPLLLMLKNIFFTSYWFVVIYFFSLALFLILSNYLKKCYLLFLGFSLFYSVNLYCKWTPTYHTTAFMGYMTYLLIGFIIHESFSQVKETLKKIPITLFFGVILGVYFLCLYEGWILLSVFHSNDWLNSLRFSNQLYSVLIFLFMLRLDHAWYPVSLKPREMTFGIYLTHTVLILFSISVIKLILVNYFQIGRPQVIFFINHNLHIALQLLLVLALFCVVYISSYITVLMLSRFNMGAIVGIVNKKIC